MVNGDRPQRSREPLCPGDGHGVCDHGDLRDHAVVIESSLERDITREGICQVLGEGQWFNPVFKRPKTSTEMNQQAGFGESGE